MARVPPPERGRSWLLDQRTGWRTDPGQAGGAGQVAADDTISLRARPGGPLSLLSEDGSLGGLVLPRGVAIDAECRVYLLDRAQCLIRRFDRETGRFGVLEAIGGEGPDARQLREPAGIAIAGHALYVAERGNRRVQVFDTRSLSLLWLWGPRDRRGRRVSPTDGRAWQPVDVAAADGVAYVLDAGHRRIYRHRASTDRLERFADIEDEATTLERIAIDREGRLYVLARAGDELAHLLTYAPDGRQQRTFSDPGEVRDRFEPPAIHLDRGHFSLPPSLGQVCPPMDIEDPCEARKPVAEPTCAPEKSPELKKEPEKPPVYDLQGTKIVPDPYEAVGAASYETTGAWYSRALDSGIYRCQWHRIELELDALPQGTTLQVWTYATDRDTAGDEPPPPTTDPSWTSHLRFVGESQPQEATFVSDRELLVQSREGRFLWLRIDLTGDGYETPSIRSLRVHYPRESYLSFLPAVYSAEEESRLFLERFLSSFQTAWDEIDQRVATFARYLDPKAVPAGDFLEWLAQWLGMPLEAEWDWEQKRRLLIAAVQFYSRRGTVDGLQAYLRAYLQNIARLPDDAAPFPRIVEGFNERERLLLDNGESGRLGRAAPLWGAGFVGRLQLDVFAREGEVNLVSTGDPERDLFHEYAHRFRVFVPSPWIADREDEAMLRRAVEAEKPAHTQFELCLVEPRFRVGVQSTVGIDTILGGFPSARLACPGDTDAPSRPPSNRLGYDTVLAPAPPSGPAIHLAPSTRVGLDTRLA